MNCNYIYTHFDREKLIKLNSFSKYLRIRINTWSELQAAVVNGVIATVSA